jgi:bifunctional non-homologous end joining protein LigD
VSKLAGAPYRSERGGLWQKIKCLKRQPFVVGGWMQSGHGRELRSVLVGYYRDGKLIFAGRVGTGFSEDVPATSPTASTSWPGRTRRSQPCRANTAAA